MSTDTKWQPYTPGMLLTCGDSIKFNDRSKLSGQSGIVNRKLRVNYEVRVGSKVYRVKPALIGEFVKGSPTDMLSNAMDQLGMFQEEELPKPTPNPDGVNDLISGDFALFYRGKFDVVQIVTVTPKLRCKVLDGRGKGKTYIYKPEWFVQKLENFAK